MPINMAIKQTNHQLGVTYALYSFVNCTVIKSSLLVRCSRSLSVFLL